MDEWMGRWIDGLMAECIDGWADGQMDGRWMDRLADGWTDENA